MRDAQGDLLRWSFSVRVVTLSLSRYGTYYYFVARKLVWIAVEFHWLVIPKIPSHDSRYALTRRSITLVMHPRPMIRATLTQPRSFRLLLVILLSPPSGLVEIDAPREHRSPVRILTCSCWPIYSCFI